MCQGERMFWLTHCHDVDEEFVNLKGLTVVLAGNLCLNHSKSPVEVWGNVTGWIKPVNTLCSKCV